ncbi:hypothetical protein V1478_016000 [Vespula squamosa]|uniref:Uncharacterized protein n=1 Tax=Vespula squamosa TaxID=30214 RepID=A0ABD2A530_VESSQ
MDDPVVTSGDLGRLDQHLAAKAEAGHPRQNSAGRLDRVIASGVSRYEYYVPTDPRRKGVYDRPRHLIATKTKPLMPTDFQGVVTDNGKGRVGTALAVKQRSVPAPATLQRHRDGTIDGKLSRATKNES